MKKKTVFFMLLIIGAFEIKAQKGNYELAVSAETTIPIYQTDFGGGFSVKGLYGIGTSAQLTLSAGVLKFTSTKNIETPKTTTRLIPFLFGYKQNIHNFFVEPQIGFGELGGKIDIQGDFARPSIAAVYGAIGAGYAVKRFNFGIRFLTTHGIENNSAGIWHNKNFHYTSIVAGYSLFAKK